MNKQQKAYVNAKAYYEAIKSEEEVLEKQYIVENNIVNPDGTQPGYIIAIEDDVVFEKANVEFSEFEEKSGLAERINAAEFMLRNAEDRLIEYGLSTMPKYLQLEKDILERSVKTNVTTRLKIIELTFKLDTKTVTA